MDLTERVAVLERTIRRLVLALVAVGSIVAGVGGGWLVRGLRSPPGEVRASRLVLVDGRGRGRAGGRRGVRNWWCGAPLVLGQILRQD
jgi:hypothetical protein